MRRRYDPRGEAREAETAEARVKQHDAWLNPPRAGAAELRKRPLTNLHNQRPTRLETCPRTVIRGWAHKRLDGAVLDA